MTAPPDAGRVLLPLARGAIARRLDLAAQPVDTDAPWVAEPGATFTLDQGMEMGRPSRLEVTVGESAAVVGDPVRRPERE